LRTTNSRIILNTKVLVDLLIIDILAIIILTIRLLISRCFDLLYRVVIVQKILLLNLVLERFYLLYRDFI